MTHVFTPDPGLPADHRGWLACTACSVLDDPRRPRSPRHQLPEVHEAQAEHVRRYDHDEEV